MLTSGAYECDFISLGSNCQRRLSQCFCHFFVINHFYTRRVTQTIQQLPQWNTTAFYPGLDSSAFNADFEGIKSDVAQLEALFEQHRIDKLEFAPDGQTATQTLEPVLQAFNALQKRTRLVGGFISCFVSTDSRNDVAQAKQSELQLVGVRVSKLAKRLTAWVGSLDVDGLLQFSEMAKDHEFALRKMHQSAKHQMSPLEEDLASSLNLSGSSAWGKLQSNISSILEVEVQGKRIPMTAARALATSADATTRKAAHDAEIAGWKSVEVPIAAALNGIKGEVNTLNSRRGYKDALEPSLEQANIDRATLEAMHEACVESFPDFRRYLRAKAKLVGDTNGLAWWNMLAPVGQSSRSWDWAEGTEFIAQQFGSYSPKLEAFARRSFAENWIDAEPRVGKRGGAFCMGVRDDESRILMNFEPSLDSLSTLAHELGHGYHNLCLKDRTPFQKSTPMTLAETASIFCETIVSNAALKTASDAEKLYILDTELTGQNQVVVDIHSRFLFESRVFKKREARELSVQEFKDLMLQAQRETYGDGLDETTLHPYMWAVKGHYYSGGLSFYNYPYTFGLLFALGLYAQYQADPEPFKARYDDLLSSTGLFDAATLAARFGINTRDAAFWRSSLDQIRGRIDEFCALVG
jgi:oligoendopeptidase F